jgi:hypothetical protein
MHAALPNPFMPRPTDPTPESRRMVARMLRVIEAPKRTAKTKRTAVKRLSKKR